MELDADTGNDTSFGLTGSENDVTVVLTSDDVDDGGSYSVNVATTGTAL